MKTVPQKFQPDLCTCVHAWTKNLIKPKYLLKGLLEIRVPLVTSTFLEIVLYIFGKLFLKGYTIIKNSVTGAN